MLSAIMIGQVPLSYAECHYVTLSVIRQSAIILNVVMFCVTIPIVNTRCVITQDVDMVKVVAPSAGLT
jgi:hypothetical protein